MNKGVGMAVEGIEGREHHFHVGRFGQLNLRKSLILQPAEQASSRSANPDFPRQEAAGRPRQCGRGRPSAARRVRQTVAATAPPPPSPHLCKFNVPSTFLMIYFRIEFEKLRVEVLPSD